MKAAEFTRGILAYITSLFTERTRFKCAEEKIVRNFGRDLCQKTCLVGIENSEPSLKRFLQIYG
ncbi:MAG: hypothetical protein QXQ91_02980, partial [Nanopusillaceae archaeon]